MRDQRPRLRADLADVRRVVFLTLAATGAAPSPGAIARELGRAIDETPKRMRRVLTLHEPAALIVIDFQRAFDDVNHWGRRNNPDCESNVAALVAGW